MKRPARIVERVARLALPLLVLGAAGGATTGCEGGGAAAGTQTPGLPTPVIPSPGTQPPTTPGPVAQNAVVTELASGMQVSTPRDLAFNPRREGELWVVNAATNSVTIVFDATQATPTRVEQRRDRNHAHFMVTPSSLAFGADATNDAALNAALALGTFATCQESRNGGNDFMGPVLWSSDLSVFAVRNGLLGSHLDMLHQSPQCMGIAWAGAGNVYWTFNGLNGSISRNDFQLDHGVGNDDHGDGVIWRYVVGQVKAVPMVPSHLAYHPADKMLYIADTGNARVVKLATTSGTKGTPIVPRQDEAESLDIDNAVLTEVVPPRAGGLVRPSGLEIQDGHLFVSDNGTGVIHKFRLDGTPVAAVQTDAQGLAGMAFGPDRKLYFVDQGGNRVLRLESPF